ncbi:MAG: DUF493 domain-containing protein [Oceanococcus sp.]
MSLHDALQAQDYPCDYPFKLICQPGSVAVVREKILESLGSSAEVKDVHQRASRSGKYISLTVVAVVANAAQVEKVYSDLGEVPGIVTSL